MKEENELKMMAYLEGSLTKEERTAFELELASSTALAEELKALSEITEVIEKLPQEVPSARLEQNFQQFLQKEKQQAYQAKSPDRHKWSFDWRIAAAVALIIIGTGFGFLWQHNQLQQAQIGELATAVATTRKLLVLSMLQQNSASERIQAIQTSTETELADPQIVAALVSTLQTDANVIVRMKAAQALRFFIHEKGVPDALVDALTKDKSPEVQIALIEILVEVGARKAIPSLQQMLKEDSVMHVVRGKAAEGLSKLL